ncbi:Glyoxalase/Bleomycin resistance protein/Dioxygenase superfamily protein [uncultured archaeon]|nr:Glyoxalase/Bleomycin resistance protein/Dioxygenase superfamily protein [uncultured archaeon]
MNPVVHFELPAENRERMVKFYTGVFGWKAQDTGPDMGHYVVVQTTDTDEAGMIKKPGAINGGIYQKTKETGGCPSVVISVDDIKAHMKKVQQAGGKILGEPMDIPGVGSFVSFVDTEGNRLSILQPKMEKK